MAAGTDLGSTTTENGPAAIPNEVYLTTIASFTVVHIMTSRFCTRPLDRSNLPKRSRFQAGKRSGPPDVHCAPLLGRHLWNNKVGPRRRRQGSGAIRRGSAEPCPA
jgi:hypothetical protein